MGRVLRAKCRVVQQTVAVARRPERIDRCAGVVSWWSYRTESVPRFSTQNGVDGLDHGGRRGNGRAPRIPIAARIFVLAAEDHRGFRREVEAALSHGAHIAPSVRVGQ